jgi:hypothetical protein
VGCVSTQDGDCEIIEMSQEGDLTSYVDPVTEEEGIGGRGDRFRSAGNNPGDGQPGRAPDSAKTDAFS